MSQSRPDLYRRAVLLVTAAAAAEVPKRVSKAEAQYQDSPRGGLSCAGCTFFRKPDACAVVEGEISPAGWCRFFDLPD